MVKNNATTITPHLHCRNAAEAVEFYQKAFGAETIALYRKPDGKVMHAALNVRGAQIFLADECPAFGVVGAETLGGSSFTLHLYVPDCDAVYQRAVDAGCRVKLPLQDMFWGDRYGVVVDPYGNMWAIATTVRQVSPEEIQEAAATVCA